MKFFSLTAGLPQSLLSFMKFFISGLVGIAADFWKNPPPQECMWPFNAKQSVEKKPETSLQKSKRLKRRAAIRLEEESEKHNKAFIEGEHIAGDAASVSSVGHAATELPRWQADRIGVVEKIWGKGMTRPADESLLEGLLVPLGLNNNMSILDLAAGMGGLARKIADEYHSYVTGLEVDPEFVKRGIELSTALGKSKHAVIAHYDPNSFVPPKQSDVIIARDVVYRVLNREHFFKAIKAGVKLRGQVVFTDFVLDENLAETPAIKDWLMHEQGAHPASLESLTHDLTALGFDVRVNEDQTKLYKKEIVKGLAQFTGFLSRHPPDKTTRPLVLHEIEKWGRRVVAMEHGLQYCRFYAIRVN